MASVWVVSPLDTNEQCSRLCEFAQGRHLVVAPAAALRICESLNLASGADSTAAARALRVELEAVGTRISQTVALEAIARLCGGSNWMRVRQQMLDSAATRPSDEAQTAYCLHALRYDETPPRLELRQELGELAADVMNLLRATWPTGDEVALCNISVTRKNVTLQFEHPTAAWLTMNLWAFVPTVDDSEAAPQPIDLPALAVHRLLAKLERALEYQFPGLLVVGGTRCTDLPPEYFFAPAFTVDSTGFRQQCASPLDTIFWLGACRPGLECLEDGTYALRTADGERVLVHPQWSSQDGGERREGAIDPSRLQSVMNRLARITRVSRLSLTDLLAKGVSGKENADGAQRLAHGKLHELMEQAGLTPFALATGARQELNTVLRIVKYGWAPLSALPSIAAALNVDPNELLPDETEQSTGLRVETGESFIRALRKTHVWRRVIGHSIQGAEAEEVEGIAESLQEYVELLQFSDSAARGEIIANDKRALEPVSEASITSDVQELLDDLGCKGIAVIVSWSVRFMKGQGKLAHMDKFPLHQGTIYLERVEQLRRPPQPA